MKIKSIKHTKISNKGWLKERFGDCVAQISTETTLRLKSSIKDVFRSIHGKVPEEIERFCKQLPTPPQGIPDKDFIHGYDANGEWEPGLLETNNEFLAFTKRYPKEWESIDALVGLQRQRGRHPCAFVISDTPISNFIPLTTVGGSKVTQFNHAAVEAMGGLKMDFLTVNIIKDVQEAVRLVQDRSGLDIDWASARKFNEEPPSMVIDGKTVPYIQVLPHNGKFFDIYSLPKDYDVFNSICEGDTESVFQFNTEGARDWLKYFNEVKRIENGKPVKYLDSIESLAVFTALDRRGPLQAFVTDKNGNKHNMLVEYSSRAKGKPYVGDNKFLNEALPETWGVIIFQEQLEKVFKELGKTTPGQAEDFRKAAAKKDAKRVLKFKETFMNGALPEVGEEMANEVWNQLVTFAEYGFCKAHAVSYVTTSYACAYLKYHFPLEWWTAVLRNAKRDEIDEKFWAHCGYLIDIPDVQTSADTFKIINNRIKAPLSLLHGIGDKAHEQLVKYAPYVDLTDFCSKIQAHRESGAQEIESEVKDKNGLVKKVIKKKMGPSALNTKVINSLIVSGAMDSLFPKTQKIGELELPLTPVDKILLFQDELTRVTGKKITKKARTELLERFKDLTDLQQYQLKKKLLPSYAGTVLPILVIDRPNQFSYNKEYYFQPPPTSTGKPRPKVAVFGGNLIAGMRNGQEKGLLPPDGIESGCVAYVIAERRFSYQNNSKTAVELIVDVEGERLKLVQWPDDKNRLPRSFADKLDGSIVVLTLLKRDGKDIRLNALYVIEKAIDTQSIDKEETPEKED